MAVPKIEGLDSSRSALWLQQPNNCGAADGIKILAVWRKLLAAADQNRYADSLDF
ncbi:hypothetical protein [Stenomitos frigidus]|uniref:hypothetical protein n=1 Tax=Stenomitos frigidus TaxID=1886765 RepID=UPI001C638C58|nr:hypothetical protein [Stenomitos frigidus]